jgi:hypothetical protein
MNDEAARELAEKVDAFLHRLAPTERDLMGRMLRLATREWLAQERQIDGEMLGPAADGDVTET